MSRSSLLGALWLALGASWGLAGCGDEEVSPGEGGGGSGGSSASSMSGSGGSNELGKPQFGNPQLASIQRIAFGPGGVVLLGDGVRDRIVAVETGDTDPSMRSSLTFSRIDAVTSRVAAALGPEVAAGDVWIQDIAVNPLTNRLYIAAQRFSTPEPSLLWIGADGVAHAIDLTQVVYVSFGYLAVQTPGSFVTGIAWLDGYVIASAMKQPSIASHFILAPTPLMHDSLSQRMRPNIYHPSSMQFITEIAIDRFFTFPGAFGEDWVGMGFAGAPIVKYEVAQIDGGAVQQTGRTQFDIGTGRSVRDALYYEDGSDGWLLVAIFNLQFDGQTLAARVHRDFLMDATFVDQNAPILFDLAGGVLKEGVERLPDFDGAEHLELVEDHIVFFRQDALVSKPLPTSPAGESPAGG